MSAGIVPIVGQLFDEMREVAEKKLGIPESECSSSWSGKERGDRLYYWAECVIKWLENKGEKNPKLKLAIALGITTDLSWLGDSDISFRGNTDRHRVIARFAKEGCWQSIWSFNWDCVIEKAMESVGVLSVKPKFSTPWQIDHFCTHITNDDLISSHNVKALAVRKPHGCVKSLKTAISCITTEPQKSSDLSERLMISKSELESRPPNKVDDAFFNNLDSDVSGHVNVAVGWRMIEASLRSRLINTLGGVPDARINIIDLVFDNDTHAKVCTAAGLDKKSSFFEVQKKDCPVTNDLFRWIHALYTLDRLSEHGGEAVDVTGKQWRETISVCEQSEFIIDWADEFLPTWTRLCWSAGLIECYGFEPHKIDLERRDEHIPLNIENIQRPDLVSAKKILTKIAIGNDVWNSRMFPGGLYNQETQCLVIPLPMWNRFNEIRALKPLVNAIKQELWMVVKIQILPINLDDQPFEKNIIDDVKSHLANFIRVPAFAMPDNIEVIYDLNSGEM